MKLLLTSPTYPPFNSGLGNAVRQQAQALRARGATVVVATSGEGRATREDTGVRIEEFAVSGADWPVHPVHGDVSGYAALLTGGGFDAVVLNAWQTWSTDVALGILDRIPARKYVYSHGLSTDLFFFFQPLRSALRWLAWRPYRWRLAARMRRLDGVIFLAEDGCDCRFADARLARRLGVPAWVVPNATTAAGPSAPHGEREGLVAVGAYDRLKGHDFVLRAYARSAARGRVPLAMFGQAFTPFTAELHALARELGIAGSVTFHEGVTGDALISVYDRALLLLSGSHTECQPLVLLDAMATGTPFVARATGCIPGLAGGRAVRTEAEMAAAIDALATDGAAWQNLSAAGTAAVREHYLPGVTGDALAAALELGDGNSGTMETRDARA